MSENNMEIGLLELTEKRTIIHPTSINEIKFGSAGDLEVRVQGCPWWLDDAASAETQTISFLFSEITHSILYFEDFNPDYDEALEDFEINSSSNLAWAQSESIAIHCSTPLTDALGLFAVVQDYLSAEKALFDARYFLNFVSSDELSVFKKITETRSYMLARAPKLLSGLICEELDRQGVKYGKSPTLLDKVGIYHVRFGETQFFCNRAVAHIST
ncbi:hypothetical protein ACFOOP_17135 [Marinicaulis aureus]|uniref:Uncharacterized protein n=1 Tax=Hyphococcus aureus TaxID=2666033 RepID=A0ABW1L0I2_9PROT